MSTFSDEDLAVARAALVADEAEEKRKIKEEEDRRAAQAALLAPLLEAWLASDELRGLRKRSRLRHTQKPLLKFECSLNGKKQGPSC